MTTSLRNLLRSFTGRQVAGASRRPAPKTRLQVESLEERAVPNAYNIANTCFELGQQAGPNQLATLYITNENLKTGSFTGYVNDYVGGQDIHIPVTGLIGGPGQVGSPQQETISFQGSVRLGTSTEGVSFNGIVTQPGSLPGGTFMAGNLDQFFSTLSIRGAHRSDVDTAAAGWGQPIPS